MAVIRLGAVDYLNARPLVHGLDRRTDLFALRFDPPSTCAALLHEGAIDVGMIPSIEFQRGVAPYLIVGGMGIVSDGPVASVALFSARTIGEIRSIAVDTSSRTSTGLLRVLCRESFGIEPEFVPMPPAIDAMLERCDAALVIGDPALYLDHQAARSVEDRPGRAVDQPDRAAVRVGVLGGPARRAVGGRADRARRRARCGRGGVRRDCRRVLRARRGQRSAEPI